MSDTITRTLKAGYLYTVTATTTCTVSTADGLVITTVEPGTQGSFVAPVDEVVFSDPDALVTQSFKGASATVSGGGGYGNIAAAISKVDTYVVDFGVVEDNLDLSGYNIDTTGRNAATDELWLEFGATVHQVTWPSSWIWLYDVEPTFSANTSYCICVRQERNGRIIADLAYEYPVTSD